MTGAIAGAMLLLTLRAVPAAAQEASDEQTAADQATGDDAATNAGSEDEAPADDAEGADSIEGEEQAEATEPTPEPETPANILEASDRLTRGISLYDNGDYAGALSEFEEAYGLVGDHPARFQILFNIARAHERLFRYDDALDAYSRYLEEGGAELENYATVQATVETLRGMLGTLIITVNVPEAEIWVDDRLVGTAPGSVSVPGGRHTVELRTRNYIAQQTEVQVAARGEAELFFELEELADEYQGLSPLFFYGGVGATVVALGVGIGFGVSALGARSTVDARTPPLATQDEIENIESLALTADIFYITAGVLAAGTIVLGIFTDWGPGDEEETTDGSLSLRIHPVFGPNVAGVVVGGAL